MTIASQAVHHLPHSYFWYVLQPQEQAKVSHGVSSTSPCLAATSAHRKDGSQQFWLLRLHSTCHTAGS